VSYQLLLIFDCWTDLKNGVPLREPDKEVTRMRDGDEFRNEG